MSKLQPKSYSDFSIYHLQTMFGLKDRVADLALGSLEIQPSTWLQTTLQIQKKVPMSTEKAKSELLITPILLEMYHTNPNKFNFFSGYTFEVDKQKSLTGRCDYLLISESDSFDIEAPVMGIFEAKDDNIDRWVGQCGAEMYAAQLFNEQRNTPVPAIYGAVTSGFDWLFLKLEANILSIDTQRYGMANLPKLLGALQAVIKKF
jgi:hypothetical protein